MLQVDEAKRCLDIWRGMAVILAVEGAGFNNVFASNVQAYWDKEVDADLTISTVNHLANIECEVQPCANE